MMNKFINIVICLFLLIACGTSSQDMSDIVGSVTLALTNVPNDVTCLQIKATNSIRTVERDLTITNGVVDDVNLEGLPTGQVTLEANAYNVACQNVISTTIPVWKSFPLTQVVTLEEGVPYSWNLVLRPNGYVAPSVDWQYDTVTSWLNSQQNGWCANSFNKHINLCGNIDFCYNTTIMKNYSSGFAIDIGFYWDGTDTGNLIDAGGDNINNFKVKLIGNQTTNNVIINQGTTSQITFTLVPGKHLISYYSGLSQLNIFSDGILIYQTNITSTINLSPSNGPGIVLGSRLSNESPPDNNTWLKFIPFFFHLKNEATNTFILSNVVNAQTSTILLLNDTTYSNNSWNSLVGQIQPYATDNMQWITNFVLNCN